MSELGPDGPDVSVGLLVHVPYLAGYHADALDVVRLAVLSARANAGRPVRLVVVDNGSCATARGWLVDAFDRGVIDHLVMNRRNLGKVTGVSQILGIAPGPDVVYADGDLCFLPGWLESMLEVREAFPDAGVIGGAPPLRGMSGDDRVPVLPTRSDVVVERGQWLPETEMVRMLGELGYVGEALERCLERIRPLEDLRIRHGSSSAYIGSSHCQYLITGAALRTFDPVVGSLALSSEEDHAFDRALDGAGFLRISVTESVYRHVGNRLSPADRAELARLGEEAQEPATPLRGGQWQRYPVRLLARWVHDTSFRVLSSDGPSATG